MQGLGWGGSDEHSERVRDAGATSQSEREEDGDSSCPHYSVALRMTAWSVKPSSVTHLFMYRHCTAAAIAVSGQRRCVISRQLTSHLLLLLQPASDSLVYHDHLTFSARMLHRSIG